MNNPSRVAVARLSTFFRPPPLQVHVSHEKALINKCASLPLTTAASDPRHPLCQRSINRLKIFATRPLRWYVFSPLSVSGKSTVRNWAKRRVQAAMKEALAARGWDEHGRGMSDRGRGDAAAALKGWVRVFADKHVVEQSYPQLRLRMDEVVQRIISKQPGIKQPRIKQSPFRFV